MQIKITESESRPDEGVQVKYYKEGEGPIAESPVAREAAPLRELKTLIDRQSMRDWCSADAGVRHAVENWLTLSKRLGASSEAHEAAVASVAELDARVIVEGGRSLSSLDELVELRSKQVAKVSSLERICESQRDELAALVERVGSAWAASWKSWIDHWEKKIQSVNDAAKVHLDALQEIQGCKYEPAGFEDNKRYCSRSSPHYEIKLPLEYRLGEELKDWRSELKRESANLAQLGQSVLATSPATKECTSELQTQDLQA